MAWLHAYSYVKVGLEVMLSLFDELSVLAEGCIAMYSVYNISKIIRYTFDTYHMRHIRVRYVSQHGESTKKRFGAS